MQWQRPLLAAALATALGLTACTTVPPKLPVGEDARIAIQLAPDEAEHLRLGMRRYLESIQGIVEALPRGKMSMVASSARQSGMVMVQDLPISVVTKLPPEFILMSLDTHQKFEALSRSASTDGTRGGALKELRDILANCTACHTMYRLSP